MGLLHRAALWLRMALVCLTLVGVGAPAPAFAYVEAVAAFVPAVHAGLGGERSAQEAPARAPVCPSGAAPLPVSVSAVAFAGPVPEAASPLAPRRLFLLHRALLD